MSAHEIVIAVMAVFAVLGALDRIFGNRFACKAAEVFASQKI